MVKTPTKIIKVKSKENKLKVNIPSAKKLKLGTVKVNNLVITNNTVKEDKPQKKMTPELKQKAIKRKIKERKLKVDVVKKDTTLITDNAVKEEKPTTVSPKLKQKSVKRKIEDNNLALNSEIKKKRRRRNKSSTKLKKHEKKVKSLPKHKHLPGVNNLKFIQVHKVVKCLLSVLEKKSKEGKNELFGDEAQKISLQINSIKKPFCPTRLLRFTLPHPLHDDLSEICLFVPDKKGVKKDIDKTVEYYTERLEENKITNISKVIPLRSISTEYTQYEMRRKLANQFDVFLTDGRISHFITKRLGRLFAYSTKTPIPMNLEDKDWKPIFQNALAKTQMAIRYSSDSASIFVGTTAQSVKEITANIKAVCLGLAKDFPGGFPNIRSLLIKTKDVPSLPVYMSIVSPNKIEVPVVKSVKAPKEEEFEGELTTMLDATVKVRSDGTVTVCRNRPKASATSDAVDNEIIKEAMKHKKQSKTVRDYEGANDNDDDNIIKKAEQKLLKKLADGGKDSDSESDIEEKDEDVEEEQPAVEVVSRRTKKKLLKEANLKKKPSKQMEKIAKTNWIKSTKKGVKKLSKAQRKASIKVKKGEKSKK